MQITLQVPDDLAPVAIPPGQDPAQAALEALAIEGYRAGRLTESQVRRMLGYETRYEVHTLLAEHNVCFHYSLESLTQDIAASDRMQTLRNF